MGPVAAIIEVSVRFIPRQGPVEGAPGGLTMEEEMKRVVFAHVLSVFLLGPAWGEDPVYFADPALKEAVESELWIADPTPTDLLGLISLSAVMEGITDLTGLEHAANLQTLDVAVNEIQSITPLTGLNNLQSLVLNNNAISDLSPLSGLVNLRR
jgi:Leucine-rich repeat (LRR) protein